VAEAAEVGAVDFVEGGPGSELVGCKLAKHSLAATSSTFPSKLRLPLVWCFVCSTIKVSVKHISYLL